VKWRQLEGMFDDGRMAAIPVNIGNLHWIGVIVDIENTKLISLDSLGGDHFEILENIHEYRSNTMDMIVGYSPVCSCKLLQKRKR